MIKSAAIFWCSTLCALTLYSVEEVEDTQPTNIEKTAKPTQTTREECFKGPQHMRAALRYTTPKGIGYTNGYTTAEGFFAPPVLKDAWLPFLDLRGHVFDSGKFAANAGLGVRYLCDSRVWGINSYYDYRNTNHEHYNQVAAGLESLGTIWDFRINGYLPVGKKQSPFSSSSFYGFKGHYLLIERSRHFAMKGANAEAGAHVDHFKSAPFYFAGGPYYLTGVGKTTWGGELRARVDLFHRYLRIEGNTSYDHFFKWIGQAQISINVSFGGRSKLKKREGRSCNQAMTLYTRAMQPVDRFEIIPEGKQKDVSKAINPATGEPWYFWFVNNTSSSEGTYESPYPTLLAAQNSSAPNQVIYVYPGDGTTNGMANGITLQEAQMLLGASVSHPIPTTRGLITIPPLASSLPNITNTSGDVVSLVNHNTVSGFNIIADNGNGLSGIGISSLFSDQNTFVTNTTDTNGIYLLNPAGQIFVHSSNFSGFANLSTNYFGNGIYVEMDSGSTLDSLNVANSFFSNIVNQGGNNGGNAILANLLGGSITNLNVSGSTFNNVFNPFSGNGGDFIFTNIMNGRITNLNITDNTFNTIDTLSAGILFNFIGTTGGRITNLNVSGSTFNGIINESNGISVLFNSSTNDTITNINVSGCTFNDITTTGLYSGSTGITVDIVFGSITNPSITSNTFHISSDLSEGFSYATSTSGSLKVNGNTFTGTGVSDNGFAADVFVNDSATVCLQFLSNSATPSATPFPYRLGTTPLGTLNLTSGSDNTTNTGQFFIQPGSNVNPPGSCSE